MTSENPEFIGAENFDFAAEFKSRMVALPYVADKDSVLEGSLYASVGISRLKRLVPVILFAMDNESLEIWIENPSKISRATPHSDIDDAFRKKFPELDNPERLRVSSAVVLEDWEAHVYLSVSDSIGKIVRIKVQEGVNQTDIPEYMIETWEDLVKKYGLHKIISRMEQRVTKNGTTTVTWENEDVLNVDIVGQYRENSFLRSFQETFQMTAAQFLRFRTLVNGAKKSNQPLNYDQLAAEIVSEKDDGDF